MEGRRRRNLFLGLGVRSQEKGKEEPFFQIRESRREEGEGEEWLFARLKPHPLLLPSSAGPFPRFTGRRVCTFTEGGGKGFFFPSPSFSALLAPSSHHHQPSMPEWNRRRGGRGRGRRRRLLARFSSSLQLHALLHANPKGERWRWVW